MNLVTVGGKNTTVWDLRKPEVPLFDLANNIKNITCVRVFDNDKRIVTSSIDTHLKVYDYTNMELVHQTKFNSPITSFDLTSDFSHLAVGHQDGTFTIKKNASKETKIERLGEDALMLNLGSNKEALNYKYFFRGIYNKMRDEDIEKVEIIKAEKMKRYDKNLQKFKYSQAFTEALSTFDT